MNITRCVSRRFRGKLSVFDRIFDRVSARASVISSHCGTTSNEFHSVKLQCELSFCPWSSFVLILRYLDLASRGPSRIPRLVELYGETATGSCSQGCNTNGRPLNDHCYVIHDPEARLHFISEITMRLYGASFIENISELDYS